MARGFLNILEIIDYKSFYGLYDKRCNEKIEHDRSHGSALL